MSDAQWKRMWELFHAHVELPSDQRRQRIAEACGGDTEMLRELEELFAEHDREDGGLDSPAAVEPAPPQSIGPYRIECTLGEGGMGVVYLAKQSEPVQRAVALKLIRPGMGSDEVLARFQQERQTLASLDHPNIAVVHDAGATPDGRPYFAMEYVDGEPLSQYCESRQLSVDRRLDLFVSICAGVQHAHQRGVIHRDLKPSNVLVSEVDGEPIAKIIDFGIARAVEPEPGGEAFTKVGNIVGTPEYMSPEQAGTVAGGVDTRTDVYALGCILYELLAGAQPFDWKTLRQAGFDEMRRIIRDVDPPRPSRRAEESGNSIQIARELSGDLDWIVLKAIEKDRERRYRSPSLLSADVDRYRKHLPIEARPPSQFYRLRKFARRHRWGVSAAAAILLALLAGATVGGLGIVRAIEAGEEAKREAQTSDAVTAFISELFSRARPSAADANSVTVRQVLDEGVQSIETTLGDQPQVEARVLVEIGTAYRALGLYEEAEHLVRRGLALHIELYGEESVLSANASRALAAIEMETDNHEAARELLEPALERLSESWGEADPRTLTTMRDLSIVYGELQRHADARKIAARALAAEIEVSGPDAPAVGRAHYKLALAYAQDGADDRVAPTLERAIEIFEANGEDPWVHYALNSLSIHYWNRGDFERAEPLCRRAYESILRTHGEEHPYSASMMNNLGLLLLEMKRYDEARPLSERALQVRRQTLNEGHDDIATSLLNVARLEAETGGVARAVQLYEEGLRIREANGGAGTPQFEAASEQLRQLRAL